ncbi:MAG: N-6 DNA methylase [Caldilineaceae bacterium]
MPQQIFNRLVNRGGSRTEADIQADVRGLLLLPQLQLDDDDIRIVSLEAQLGDGRRIDVEIGCAAIEIKKDLRPRRVKAEAVVQLRGYVEQRTRSTGTRYVGILTDGVEWHCYDLVGDDFRAVSSFDAQSSDVARLAVWLEGVLATARGIPATAAEISTRLGAGSSAHALDRATIAGLYEVNRDLPTVRMKRGLWSKLLTSTLGNQFEDTDELFVEHTLLVNSAEIVAHSVLGLDVTTIDPQDVLAGTAFTRSSIYGVVEQDFFDWPLEVVGGPEFVRALTRRLARFEWATVEQDVLKTLYESVITPETRKRLGEYYTPDWLAQLVVEEAIDAPLNTRALDPACGSGTFLFHAVRRYVEAGREAGQSVADILAGVSNAVYGMDLHPVAVTLARVTYLLAIGPDLLRHPERGPIFIPVYLGDSIQWDGQSTNLWNAGDLVVQVEDAAELFQTELRFPDRLLADARMFDRLVEELAQLASRREAGSRTPSLAGVFQRHGVPTEARAKVDATFATMCELHDQGRNHIWSYYIRNLARPMWLAREANRVDVLVGNPPWLAYRHMPEALQSSFRAMEEERGLWAGAENATHQDLSALFVVRAVELYLRNGGRFGLVMPNAVVDRAHYDGFRRGSYVAASSRTLIRFERSWDFRRVRPHFFPRGSSVIFGTRDPEISEVMPVEAAIYSGRIGRGGSLRDVRPNLAIADGAVTIRSGSRSPYSERFRQGAILAPRFMFFVERQAVGPLGSAAGQVAIRSSRSVNEKKPWKDMAGLEGVVEERFLHPMFSGETLLPYRNSASLECIVPHDGTRLLRESDEIAVYSGMLEWWSRCEAAWENGRSSVRLSLVEQLDYMGKLSAQFPIPPLRVVYNSSGMHLAAAKLYDPSAVVNNKLYWCAVRSDREADYLCAILNSPVTTDFVRPLMSYGKDERDIHKHVWKLPIPEFDEAVPMLSRLADLGAIAARAAAEVEVRENVHFSALRRDIRNAIEGNAETAEIDDVVFELLS